MWLINSSIGRKVVMSVTGIALVLFLTFHASMNVVALISAKGYNMICEFLGANWYAVAATLALAALVALHFIYAIWLTIQNQKARGTSKYSITSKPGKVEWASQNMLVLGVIVVLGLCLHLYNFWYNMMYAELAGVESAIVPTDGVAFIVNTFSCPIYTAIYIIWLVALWFHLSHGFWSAFQTLGWNGKVWFNRWKVIGKIYTTLVILMFAAVAIAFSTGIKPSDYETRNQIDEFPFEMMMPPCHGGHPGCPGHGGREMREGSCKRKCGGQCEHKCGGQCEEDTEEECFGCASEE